VEAALGNASRILPVITTAHGASGSNNSYWPEMYMNMPIVDPNRAQPYRDTPDPKVFGTVGAFDPQLFTSVEECAEALANGRTLAKYTSLEVAQWLDDMSAAASQNQALAVARASNRKAPEIRRVVADIAIQAGTGRFFAYKIRSAVLWSLYQRTGDRAALAEAAKAYRTARQAWASMAEAAKTVYASDVTYGLNANMRGHWLDRLPGIDGDLADMERRLAEAASPRLSTVDPGVAQRAIAAVLSHRHRPAIAGQHTPPPNFDPGKPLEVSASFGAGSGLKATLLYRHADQSQRWRSLEMEAHDNRYRAAIPADYTQTPFPLLYFEVRDAAGSGIYPGFNADLSNQPYYLLRSNRPRG
jgi:hypothetical protein